MESLIPDLADVATVSAGAALLATILKEGVWYMVLAAMKIKEMRDQVRREERENQRRRREEAYAKFGVEVNGVLMLSQTPEVELFLAGGPEAEQ